MKPFTFVLATKVTGNGPGMGWERKYGISLFSVQQCSVNEYRMNTKTLSNSYRLDFQRNLPLLDVCSVG